MPLLRSPTGAVAEVPDEQIGNYVGYTPLEGEEASAATTGLAPDDRGVLGGINAAATGLLSGATLGGSDYLLKGVLNQGQFERLAAEREGHPIAAGIGQVAGAVLPALANPESILGQSSSGALLRATPSGFISGLTGEAVATGRAIGGAEGFARQLAASGVEGAAQNAGMYLSDTALGDRELSAEGLAASLGPGFAFGVGGGAAALGIEQGTIAARRLFSRAAGTDKAAEAAKAAWDAHYASTVEANDAAADIARARLAEARAAREQAQLAKQRAGLHVAETEQGAAEIDAQHQLAFEEREQVRDAAKAQYEAASPPAVAATPTAPVTVAPGVVDNELNQLSSRREVLRELGYADDAIDNMTGRAADEIMSTGRRAPISDAAAQDLAQAVAEHDAARAELDDLLRNMKVPDVEPVGPTPFDHVVPIAEWGPPGMRGYDPGNVKAPGPPSVVEAATGDMTAVGKRKLGQGTPAEVAPSVNEEIGAGLGGEQKGPPAPFSDAEYAAHKEKWGNAADAHYANEMRYSQGGDEVVNPALRSGKPLEGEAAKLRDGLDAAFREPESRTPRELTLYRGLSDNPVMGITGVKKRFANVKPGDILEDPAYTSSAFSEKAKSRNEEVVFTIHAPAGTPALPLRTHYTFEGEMLLPRSTKMRVDKVEYVPVSERWQMRPDDKFEVLPDKSVKFTYANGETHTQPPIKDISVTIVSKFDPPAAVERHAVDLSSPIDKLSRRQLKEHQSLLHKEFDKIERGTPEYQRMSDRWDAAANRLNAMDDKKIADVPDWIGASGKSAPDTRSLTGQLRSMQSQLGEGAGLSELGAPARAEYAAVKATKTKEAAEHFRAKASEKNYAGSAMAADEKAARAAAPAKTGREFDDFFANLTRPKTRDAYVAANIGRAMREEGSHAAALEKVEREWAAMPRHPSEPANQDLTQYLDPHKTPGGLRFDPETRQYIDGGSPVGAMRSAVHDVADAAHVVTNYEKASAKLTEALGAEAPPAAQEAAKAFRAAEEHAERKTMERTTRAIDDSVDSKGRPRTKVYMSRKESEARMAEGSARNAARSAEAPSAAAPSGPARPSWEDMEAKYGKYAGAPPLPPTSAEALAKAKAARGVAGTDFQRARIAETEAKIGARQATETATNARAAMPPAPTAAPATGSMLGSIATTIGVAGELGVPGIPHPHDIPVIGPLLGTYLKYKAIKAAAGRFVGRIPATGDARAAALVAKAKDKIATAVDRTLGLVAETAPKARRALVATSTVLGHRLIDDGEPDAPKNANAQQLAAVRIREIANAAARPEIVTDHVRREMRGVVDPDLIAAAEQHLVARFEALNKAMPKAPPPNPYSKREWLPSPAAAYDVAQRLSVVHDPDQVFVNPTPAKCETFAACYPRLLDLAQQRLIERVGDTTHPVDYNARLRSSLVFKVPLDDSHQPDHAAILATAHAPSPVTDAAPQPQGPTPAIAGNTNLSAVYQTASDRRAMR